MAVLWVEDSPETVQGAKLRIEAETAAEIKMVGTVRAAEQALLSQTWQFLILDLRLPYDDPGKVDLEAGGDLVEQLKSGKLGQLNQAIGFAVYTAVNSARASDRLRQLPGFKGVLPKADVRPLVKAVRDVVGASGALSSVAPKRWRTLVDVLEVDSSGFRVTVLSWDVGREIVLPFDQVPADVRESLSPASLPVLVAAQANLAAEDPDDLHLNSFELLRQDISDEELGLNERG